MKNITKMMNSFPRQLAVLTLASAIAIPVCVAQDQVNTGTSTGVTSQSTPPSATQQQQPPPRLNSR